MEIDGLDIFKYGFAIPRREPGLVAGLFEKPDAEKRLQIWRLLGVMYSCLIFSIFCVISLLERVVKSNWLKLSTPRLKTILLKLLNLTGVALIAAV
jgi:hypothetical protein